MHQIFILEESTRKEVLIRQKDDEFIFPTADGTAKLSGRDFEFREPTLRRNKPQGAKISVENFMANLESLYHRINR